MRRSPSELWIVSRVFTPDEGGVQTYARAIATAYVQLGWRVRVFAKTSLGPRRVREHGYELVDVGDGHRIWVYCKLGYALLRAALSGPRPAAIHATTWRSAMLALLFPLAPVTVTVHGREVGRPAGLGGMKMHRVLKSAARVVAVSQWTRRCLLKRLPEVENHCVVAWNGLSDLDLPVPEAIATESSVPLVFTVCRLVPRKNIQRAIAAAADCKRRGLAFRYLIAGRGPETAALQREIDAHGLQDQVQLLGFVSNAELATLYAQTSVFMHPQIDLEGGAEMEGFGIAVADAMAAGKACLVGSAGGPAELVEDGVTGRVVDGSDTAQIASALADMLNDLPGTQRMGIAAREWSKRLSWEAHCLLAVGAPQNGTVKPVTPKTAVKALVK